MRRWAPAILLSISIAACSSDGATPSPGSNTTPILAPTTSTSASTSASTTTTTQLSETHSDPALTLDRSILGLALEPGETGPGRFRLERGRNTEILMTVEGRYWVTDPGNVYTALDIDPDLVAVQMGILTDAVEGTGGQPDDSLYLNSLREHYRGDEFQIGLTDLVRSLAVGGLSAEWAEQWSWFLQADGEPAPPDLVACRDAIATLDQAARRWVHNLAIEFTGGTWAFPVAGFEEALATEIKGASICELFVELPGPSPDIVIGLSGGPDRRRIEVLVDDKTYTDREPELMFAIVMWPDESIGPPPTDPNPASLLTLRGSYLTAIGVCGELPWIYSNFAAADTYYGPESGGYPGPVVFASSWYCHDEVPEDRRREGG